MSADWQISAAYLSELLRPILFALAALASAWVLYDTRRRGLGPYAVVLWTLFALVLPHITLPFYLAVRLFARRTREEASTQTEAAATQTSGPEDLVEQTHLRPDAVSSSSIDTQSAAADKRPRLSVALPLLYAALLISAGVLYFYSDYKSADGHLARAESAKLLNERERAIREYRAALAIEDDAHTRKLLGVELLNAERWEESLVELRAAEAAGEPDDAIPFHLATALAVLDRHDEAAVEYKKFLATRLCTQPPADPRCDTARKAAIDERSADRLIPVR